MIDLADFKYREQKISATDIFTRFDPKLIKGRYEEYRQKDLHQMIFDVSLAMWEGEYDFFLDNFGFYQSEYSKFSGHCHQITPVLAIVLQSLGLEVAYLECFRADPKTLEQIPPEEEQSAMREEFCSIGRIPYCCLEVKIDGKKFYLTGKHLKNVDGKPTALLSPICYRDFIGVFKHQSDPSKSGVYLDVVQDKPLVWKKQTERDPEPEYFKTFLYMKFK